MKFRGFDSPRWIPTLAALYDFLLGEIDSLAELKVVLYVIRHTHGWGKFIDRISLSQFMHGVTKREVVIEDGIFKMVEVRLDRGTGLSQPSVTDGLRRAVEHGYLVRYMVCGRCQHEIFEEKPPAKCPLCEKPYRGREQYYYSLNYLSTELSTRPKELRVHYLRSLGGTPQEFLGVLPKFLCPQETTEQETIIQETNIQDTDNSLSVVVELLSAFGFKRSDCETIAEEALEAGLTVEDVARWIEYVCDQTSLTNPRGFLRAKLRSGEVPPALADAEEHDLDRYISGRYADYIKY
jgi:hypothetical protein